MAVETWQRGDTAGVTHAGRCVCRGTPVSDIGALSSRQDSCTERHLVYRNGGRIYSLAVCLYPLSVRNPQWRNSASITTQGPPAAVARTLLQFHCVPRPPSGSEGGRCSRQGTTDRPAAEVMAEGRARLREEHRSALRRGLVLPPEFMQTAEKF